MVVRRMLHSAKLAHPIIQLPKVSYAHDVQKWSNRAQAVVMDTLNLSPHSAVKPLLDFTIHLQFKGGNVFSLLAI